MDAPDIAALLQCPACRSGRLVAAGDGDRCTSCGVLHPRLAGLRWLFPDPSRSLGEWRNRLGLYLDELTAAARLAEADLALADGGLSQRRIERLARAYREQVTWVSDLLAPLALARSPLGHATPVAFGTRLPLRQDLHSYYPNLHRDWSWGDAENDAAHGLVSGALGARRERLLVLGAGACRLAYDLHQAGAAEVTVALDINPLLLFAAERIVRGGAVELYEFPIAPRHADDVAVLRRLAAPEPARPGLTLVCGDAWAAPFAPQSFDAVITPWLIDIVEPQPADVAASVNRLLAPGGRWVNFGSLSFPWRRPGLRLAPDELLQVVEGSGFTIDGSGDHALPYMQSPASRHARLETVFMFAADKVRRTPRPMPVPPSPTWIEDPNQAVPSDEIIALAAEAARIRAIVLSLVDGRRSTADLIRVIVEQGLLPAAQAESAVRDLLEHLHDESLRGGDVR